MADDQTIEELTRAIQALLLEMKNNKTVDPKEIDRLDKALKAASRGTKSQTDAQKMQTDATDKNTKGTVRFASALGGTVRNVGTFATSLAQAATDIQNNQESFTSLNATVDLAAGIFKSTGKLVGGVGDSIGEALSSIPVLGGVIGGLVSGVSKATAALAEATADVGAQIAKQVTAQLDNASQAMAMAGQAGAIGAEGLTGLTNQAIQAGLSFKDFANVTKTQGEGLAFAFGNATKGAQMLANTSDAMRPFRRELEALGIGAKQQNEMTAQYMKLQARTGSIEGRSARELAQGSAEYAKRLTTLARLTGKSVDEQQKELDAMMSNTRMVGAMADATAKFGPEAADKMADTAAGIAGLLGQDAAKGVQDALAGNLGTANAQILSMSGGPKAMEAIEKLRNNQISAADAQALIIEGFAETGKKMGGPGTLGAIGGLNTVIEAGIAPMQKAMMLQGKSAEELNALADETKKQAKAQDPATQGLIDGKNAMRESAEEINKIVRDQLPKMGTAATTVAKTMTDAMREINKMINMGAEAYVKDSMLGTANTDEIVEAQDESNTKYMTTMEKASTSLAKGIEFMAGLFSTDLENKMQAVRVQQQTAGGMSEKRFGKEDLVEGYKLEKKALGGPVEAGGAYIVGEQGPEMLISKASGNIIPNNELSSLIGGTPTAGDALAGPANAIGGGGNMFDTAISSALSAFGTAADAVKSGIGEVTGSNQTNALAEAQLNRLDMIATSMARSVNVQTEILNAAHR